MTPLARTLVAIVSAEPNEWTVATLAEDLDVSERAIRHALSVAVRAGYDLVLRKSELALRLRDFDTSGKSRREVAIMLGTTAEKLRAAVSELRAQGIEIRFRRPKRATVATRARVLELHAAYPGPHSVHWYAEHIPASVRSVKYCFKLMGRDAPPTRVRHTGAQRKDLVLLAQVLSESGMHFDDIAAEVGVAVNTARDYIYRPSGRRRVRA